MSLRDRILAGFRRIGRRGDDDDARRFARDFETVANAMGTRHHETLADSAARTLKYARGPKVTLDVARLLIDMTDDNAVSTIETAAYKIRNSKN